MATTSKSGAARKRGSATRSKPAATATATKSGARADRDKELTKQVLEMRKADKTWGAIGEALGITGGKAAFLYLVANVKPKDRIKHDGTEADIAAKIVAAREKDNLAYPVIAARMGIPESRVKSLYLKTSKKPITNLPGKGGRAANGAKPAAAKSAKAGSQAKAGRARQSGAKASGGAKGGAGRRGGTGRRGSSRPQRAAK